MNTGRNHDDGRDRSRSRDEASETDSEDAKGSRRPTLGLTQTQDHREAAHSTTTTTATSAGMTSTSAPQPTTTTTSSSMGASPLTNPGRTLVLAAAAAARKSSGNATPPSLSPVRRLPSLLRTATAAAVAAVAAAPSDTRESDAQRRGRSFSLNLGLSSNPYGETTTTNVGVTGYNSVAPVPTASIAGPATTTMEPTRRGYYGRTRDDVGVGMPMSALDQQQQQQQRAAKRRLAQTGFAASANGGPYERSMGHGGSRGRHLMDERARAMTMAVAAMNAMNATPTDDDDALSLDARGSHGPRDETRYETWTSKQLRKKCSHLKLRGLKNVKKHVMVEALYRYYRNHRTEDDDAMAANMEVDGTGTGTPTRPTCGAGTRNLTNGAANGASGVAQQVVVANGSGRSSLPLSSRVEDSGYSRRYERSSAASSPRSAYNGHAVLAQARGSMSMSMNRNGCAPGSSVARMLTSAASENTLRREITDYARGGGHEEETKSDHDHGHDRAATAFARNEIVITSEDVIRLVDVMLSHDFVDRLKTELTRWQFWVDAREKYLSLLHSRGTGRSNDDVDAGVDRLALSSYSRLAATWSSMQLWEMWKELTFAYTKTCFEFTAAGAEERDYIGFCEGRPDVYYLHQRLHARPDLLHLIRSNEYIEEHCTSEGSDTMSNDKTMTTNNIMGVSDGGEPAHKRFKRIAPAPATPSTYPAAENHTHPVSTNAIASAIVGSKRPARVQYMRPNTGTVNSPEEGSTENSETTGEDGSIEKSHTTNSSVDLSRREALMDQRYFGLLLQNFEAIFESLHNKKVLLAALRKDSNAPDHLIADLHDDIHVLSALKKEFRNKLRQTLDS